MAGARPVVLCVCDGQVVSERRLGRLERRARRRGVPLDLRIVAAHQAWWAAALGHLAAVPDHLLDEPPAPRREAIYAALRQRLSSDVPLRVLA